MCNFIYSINASSKDQGQCIVFPRDAAGPVAAARERICVTAWAETHPRAAVAHAAPRVGLAEEIAGAPRHPPLLPAAPGLSAIFPVLLG